MLGALGGVPRGGCWGRSWTLPTMILSGGLVQLQHQESGRGDASRNIEGIPTRHLRPRSFILSRLPRGSVRLGCTQRARGSGEVEIYFLRRFVCIVRCLHSAAVLTTPFRLFHEAGDHGLIKMLHVCSLGKLRQHGSNWEALVDESAFVDTQIFAFTCNYLVQSARSDSAGCLNPRQPFPQPS